MISLKNQIYTRTKLAKIILVEDNKEIVNWIKDKINNLPNVKLAGVSGTYTGSYEMILRENPKLVILDLKLPDGNGIEILKRIKKTKPGIKVFILTTNIQVKNICLQLGADGFFDKSNDTDILIEKLKNL